MYENYSNCVNFLVAGTLFKNTNGVPGYEYKPWTVQELLEASEHGVPMADEGDWSGFEVVGLDTCQGPKRLLENKDNRCESD